MARKARFYKASAHDADMGDQLSWHRLRRDALAAVEAAKELPGYVGPSGVEPVTIELSTDGVIAWLNLNFTSDNG